MNLRLLAAFLTLGTLFSGCVVVDRDDDCRTCDNRPPRETAVTLHWSFPANADSPRPSCELAGTPYVAVFIDGRPQQAFVNGQPVRIRVAVGEGQFEWRDVVPCAWGQSAEGFRVVVPSGGRHDIELVAVDEQGFEFYGFTGDVYAQAGSDTDNDYGLQWSVGGLNVQWRLVNRSGVAVTCGQAGVSEMYVAFVDVETGAEVYQPSSGLPWGCGRSDAYFFLTPGAYKVFVWDAGATVYDNARFQSPAWDAAPTLIVDAGVFMQPLRLNVRER
jgi:hypothetical protein